MAYHNPQLIKILAVIVKKPGNNQCADCSMPNPTWASFNLGLFICMNCSGVHRMLGTHITRIRSITLDNWDEAGVQTMAQVGNRVGNSYWEARLPSGMKINAGTDERTRTQYIRNKYENRLWYGQPTPSQQQAAVATDDEQADTLRPGEENLTRAEKIARRKAQREAQGVSRPASVQPGMAGVASNGTLGVTSPPPPGVAGHAPSLRHAISSPQIATHTPHHSSGGGDLFAGMATSSQTLSPTYAQQATSPIAVNSPPQQRPKRQTGASPWVQRPAGSEPPVAAFASLSVADNSVTGNAASAYYATMASGGGMSGAGGPIDLMGLADNGGPASAPAAAAASFDFLNDSAPAPHPPATSPPPALGGAGSAFDFLGGGDEQPAAGGPPGGGSGFDFMGDSGAASQAGGFGDGAAGGVKKSRITDDMFSGLVPEDDDATPVVSLEAAGGLAPPVPKANIPAPAKDAPLPSLGNVSTHWGASATGGGSSPIAPGTSLDDALTSPMPPAAAAYPPYPYPYHPYPPPGAYPPHHPAAVGAGPPPANGGYPPYPPYPYPPPGAYPQTAPGGLTHPHHPSHPHPHHPHHGPPFYPYYPPPPPGGYPPVAAGQPPPQAAGGARSDPFAIVNPIAHHEPSPPAASVAGEDGGSAFGFM